MKYCSTICIYNSGDDLHIEQKIELLKNNLYIPKRRNPNAGGTRGRATEIDVNLLPLDLNKLFKNTIYHFDVKFIPEIPKRLLRYVTCNN